MDFAFANATRPAQCVILKLPMLDYSIGHELLLLREQNPLVILDGGDFLKLHSDIQIAAIMEAALICSQTWKQSKQKQSPRRLWGWRNRKANWPHEIDLFWQYRAGGSTYPEVLPPKEDEDGRLFGGPFLARVLNHVRGDYDYPLGEAQWLYLCHLETEGACRIENAKERQIREEIEGHKADYAREQAEKKSKEVISP